MDLTTFNDYNRIGKTNQRRLDSIGKHIAKLNGEVIGVEQSLTDYEEFAYIHFLLNGDKCTARVNNSKSFWLHCEAKEVDDDNISNLTEMKLGINEIMDSTANEK